MRLAVGALVWSAGLVLVALLAPLYSTSSASESDGVTLTHSTLVQVNGDRALVLMAIPALASLVVLWAIRVRGAGARWAAVIAWTAVGALTAETLLGILTIGVFILPVVVLLAAAVRLTPAQAVERPAREPVAGT